MKNISLTILLIASVILSACSGLKLQKYPSETCTKMPDEQTFKVITEKCSLCHKKDFETKELICARKSMITDAVQSGRMPKFKKLSDEELKIILKWGM